MPDINIERGPVKASVTRDIIEQARQRYLNLIRTGREKLLSQDIAVNDDVDLRGQTLRKERRDIYRDDTVFKNNNPEGAIAILQGGVFPPTTPLREPSLQQDLVWRDGHGALVGVANSRIILDTYNASLYLPLLGSIIIQEGDVDVVNPAGTIDFAAGDFDVTVDPLNGLEANIALSTDVMKLSNDQTITGIKTFSSKPQFNAHINLASEATPTTVSGDLYNVGGSLRWHDGTAGQTVWHQGNDGSGSGLDADLLDGIDSGTFAWRLIDTVTVSPTAPVATVDFTSGIDSTYKAYAVVIAGLVPDTDSVTLYMRVSEDGGATWKAGLSDYTYANFRIKQDGTTAGYGSGSGDSKIIPATTSFGSDLRENGGLTIFFDDPANTSNEKHFRFLAAVNDPTAGIHFYEFGGGTYKSANAINGIRFLFSTGRIEAGTFKLYGLN